MPQRNSTDTRTGIPLDTVVKAIPDLMFLVDEEGIHRDIFADNKETLLYVPREMAIGKSVRDVFEPALAESFLEAIATVVTTGNESVVEYPLSIGGKVFYFEARIVPSAAKVREKRTVLAIVREVTKAHERAQMARLIENVFEDATEGMMIENSDRVVVQVNPAMQKILEMDAREILGKHSEFFNSMMPPEVVEEIHAAMVTSAFWHGEAELTLPSGRRKLAWVSINTVFDDRGNIANFLVMVTDISEVKRSRDQLEHMANYDVLTGLPNRVLLFDRLEHAIAAAKRSGNKGALLFMDIDHFKEVNDSFGHHVGDRLLVDAARRLREAVRASDTFGRLGGDEFLMILENTGHIDEVMAIIQKIRERFDLPFILNDVEVEITLSIGVALMPDDGEDAETLVNAADRAMYVVKTRGRDGFEFYSEDYSVLSHEYFRIQRAIREEAFIVVFQPQFDIHDGRLSGAEALLRCTLDALRDVPVEKLIEVAEESGSIYEIGAFVFRTVCAQIAQWRAQSLTPMRVAVNLSRRELGSDRLVGTVRESIAAYGADPSELEFEITESTLMQSGVNAHRNIETLRAMGCSFSIDDFGTGYSSLSNLKEFDLDKLKIDRSFIDTLESDTNDQAIVSATISMAKKLGLRVLAEGVEREEQVRMLRRFDCDEVQGFLYSRPVSGEEMTELLLALNG